MIESEIKIIRRAMDKSVDMVVEGEMEALDVKSKWEYFLSKGNSYGDYRQELMDYLIDKLRPYIKDTGETDGKT